MQFGITFALLMFYDIYYNGYYNNINKNPF